MNLKEIREKMREDEAKQRQLIRYADICSKQMQYVSPLGITDMVNKETTTYPNWFTHFNSHGMIYSQYNVQNYGITGSKVITSDQQKRCVPLKKKCHTVSKTIQSDRERSARESQVKATVKSDATCFTEDSLFKSTCHPFTPPSTVELMEPKTSNDNVLNLLYRANLSNRVTSSSNTSMKLCPLRGNNNLQNLTPLSPNTCSTSNTDCMKVPARENEENIRCSCCNVSDTTTKCNLPRKLAAHNSASPSLCPAEDEDDSAAMTFARSDSSLVDLDRNSDSDFDVSEIQIVEEIDQGKAVVSPLIKKAETALADLQKNDTLFATMDDFGNLMNQASYLL